VTIRDALRHEPRPLPPPEVCPDLMEMPPIERSGEVMRYQLLRLERSLSPGGILREWGKIVLRCTLVAALPAFLFVPVLTYLLHGFSQWSVFARQTAANLVIAVPALLLLILMLKLLARLLSRR
jgi:hypothetical protein